MERYRYNEEKGILENIEVNDIKVGDLILLYYRYQREEPVWKLLIVENIQYSKNGKCISYKHIINKGRLK